MKIINILSKVNLVKVKHIIIINLNLNLKKGGGVVFTYR